jgi:hypothetical protein
MAQDVNAPHREDHNDEEWFDLQSLAPEDDPSETPIEVWSARKARAYYAPAPSHADKPPPSVSSYEKGPGVLGTYGPLLYFAFLALVPIVGTVLFVWSSSVPSPEEQAIVERVQPQAVTPAPSTADRNSVPLLVPSPTSFRVNSDPEGAYVYVDGALAGITPHQDGAIESGWRTVVLTMRDHAERDTLVYVDPEAATTLTLALDPLVEAPISAASSEPPPAPVVDEPVQPNREAAVTAQKAGELRVTSIPDRAVVRLGGEVMGRTPLLLGDLAPGMYDLALSMPGYASQTRRVDVGPGRRATVRVELVARTGTLSVLVHPWGSIYIDGTLLARDTDLRRSLDVAAGSHVVRVVHPVLGVQERRVDVQAGQTTSVTFDLL